jgi:hypothetical protein
MLFAVQSWMVGQDTGQETPHRGELAFLLAGDGGRNPVRDQRLRYAAVLACASLYPLVRIKELPAEKKSLDRGGLL